MEADTATPSTGLAVALPAGTHIRYEGLVNLDRAGSQQGPMMYPGFGLAGFIAAIATHGAITASVRNAEKTRLQEEADAVLKPYQPVLERIPDDTLVQDGLKRLQGTQPASSGVTRLPWHIQALPVFRLTQDETAIVLDHAIRIQPDADPGSKPLFDGTVRVVSTPLGDDPPQARWLADDGRLLRETLGDLYARSLDVALRRANGAAAANPADTMKTVRYDEGRAVRVERAKVIEAGCDRWLVENLRGWLLSVPIRDTLRPPECPKAPDQPR